MINAGIGTSVGITALATDADATNNTILYTLDGTNPIAKSNPYLAPIDLASGGNLKAAAFTQDRRAGSEVVETNLPNDGSQLSLAVDPIPMTSVTVTNP